MVLPPARPPRRWPNLVTLCLTLWASPCATDERSGATLDIGAHCPNAELASHATNEVWEGVLRSPTGRLVRHALVLTQIVSDNHRIGFFVTEGAMLWSLPQALCLPVSARMGGSAYAITSPPNTITYVTHPDGSLFVTIYNGDARVQGRLQRRR